MSGEKPDLLKEIFDQAESSSPPAQRPRFEYPPEEEADSPPPPDSAPPPPPDGTSAEKAGPANSAKLLPWLCLVLGFALLVLGICVLQVTEMNGRLDQLQEAVEAVQAVDSLRAENERLQQDLEDLQGQLDQQTALNERFMETWDEESTRIQVLTLQKQRLEYLWYISQFMENGDWPMAALAVVLSADSFVHNHYAVNAQEVYLNPSQTAQYQAYRRELTDRGYLQLTYGSLIDNSPHTPVFQEQWDPSKSEDMAALGILWAALDAHFIQENDEMASQYLCRFPLSSPNSGYRERVERLASGFTLEQFQLLKDELVADEWLIIREDGVMGEGYGPTNVKDDLLYGLPFDPPHQDILYGDPNYGGADQTN